MGDQFNTEFPSHGERPRGYTGPIPEREKLIQDAKAETANDGKQSGSESGDASESASDEIIHPDRIDSTGDGMPDDQGNIAPPPTLLAWSARIITIATLFSLIGYLLFLCLRDPVSARFDIVMDFDRAEQRGSAWVLPVEVTNTSTESMGNVTVEVVQGETTRSFELLLMGEGEMGDAEVRLPDRPTLANTQADVVSYVSP